MPGGKPIAVRSRCPGPQGIGQLLDHPVVISPADTITTSNSAMTHGSTKKPLGNPLKQIMAAGAAAREG
jgi:hypothetical protein